ncbi:DMT family transporter [Poseidonibacter ostreae]|jgi:drug/metabolite transporter (DMT)-like permease|uniref:EamA family transporter n=1 Tax=Poseidonibacter ostreae TaxID=2654171 RepID=A0A6L4WTW0_9BACT|nr:DMT family transporter [Poseidonibacter ostreae]KAB7889474.1 EamA family transporter [Poseidonibacter ostreae]KAB7892511.1 EamA family transporter [Poseidonibacter ostreae]MAC83592.1 EamA family transporter [Arcobacter sp.]|tara:strand:+ start:2444 stop:3325 length:882 start_codon:yes stop_codon:yes gene_type:complete
MKYYVFLTLTVLFWSGNFVFGRLISTDVEPLQLAFFRWFFVALILLPYLIYRFKHIMNVLKKEYFIIILFSILGISAFNTLLYYGLQTTTATNALLINSSIPIMIIVLSAVILKTRITKLQSVGIILSTLGVFFLILKGELKNFITLEFTSGDLWILLACVTWALYTVILKYKPKELNAFDFLSITTFIGIVVLAFVFFSFGYSFELSFLEKDEVLYSFIYMVIFPSLLSFYFWNMSIVEVGANKAGQFTHLMPIFGAILAYIFLGERLELYHLVGILFIAVGIYLSIFLKKA